MKSLKPPVADIKKDEGEEIIVKKGGKKNENQNKQDDFDIRGGRGYNATKTVLIGPFPNFSEEKKIIREIDKMVDESTY